MGRTGHKYLVWPLVAVVALALAAACGGGGGGGGGAGGAEDTVRDFIVGWQKSSDDIAAGQVRQLLGGELFAGVEGVLSGGANPGSSGELGSTKRLDKIYNEYMHVPIPPDGMDGELYQLLSSSVTDDGDGATVQVKLIYTANAAPNAFADGKITLEQVQTVHEEVIVGPERTFVLQKIDGKWKIVQINEG